MDALKQLNIQRAAAKLVGKASFEAPSELTSFIMTELNADHDTACIFGNLAKLSLIEGDKQDTAQRMFERFPVGNIHIACFQ